MVPRSHKATGFWWDSNLFSFTLWIVCCFVENWTTKWYYAGLFLIQIHAARANVPAHFLHRNHRKFMALPSPSGLISRFLSLSWISSTRSIDAILISNIYQLMAAFLVSFVAVMAIIGTNGHIPISLGTPGLVKIGLFFIMFRLISTET